jgi:hypothetical protein
LSRMAYSTIISVVGIVDKSIVRPVLDAINEIRSSRQDLTVYYGIIDQFSAIWLGKPRSEMSLEEEDTIYLCHELLREYLRFEGNDTRVALWLLTINRCCKNHSTDLSEIRKSFSETVEAMDLSFDRTLLSPIIEKVNMFESRHSEAAARMGAGDIMGSFYQWIGLYCTYVYPRLVEDTQERDAAMVSTLALLISEFISLKDHVSRMAALLLGIKEACAIGSPSGETAEVGKAMDETVAPGTESEYVEQILEKLGAESASGQSADKTGMESRRPLKAGVAAAAEKLERAEPGEFTRIIEEIERWGREEFARDGRAFRRETEALLARETRRSREAARRITSGLRGQPDPVRRRLEARLRGSSPSGRNLLARLIVLALMDIVSR